MQRAHGRKQTAECRPCLGLPALDYAVGGLNRALNRCEHSFRIVEPERPQCIEPPDERISVVILQRACQQFRDEAEWLAALSACETERYKYEIEDLQQREITRDDFAALRVAELTCEVLDKWTPLRR